MVQNTKEAIILPDSTSESTSFSSDSMVRSVVLNYLFRFDSLTDNSDKLVVSNPFLVSRIAKETIASEEEALYLLECFFEELELYWDRLRSIKRSRTHKRDELYDISCKYLHQAYKIAPIFNLQRAEKNLKILHALFSKEFFWPKVSIQLTLVVFVTDRNDSHWKNIGCILQKNLRTFLSCSAYAFHRSRNKLRINKDGQIE
jgi:hypothetical protein